MDIDEFLDKEIEEGKEEVEEKPVPILTTNEERITP